MADWFKFFENDLDETRLKYAINKLPEVVSVWVGILSECCRHKSDTIKWGNKEFELFGFSQRLNISLGKVNEATNLLNEIEYIEKANGHIKVLRWNDKQSEYCQRKMKESATTPDSVGTTSAHSPLRGEESRGDKKLTTKGASKLSNGKWELSKSFEEQLGDQWVNDAGKWVNRIKSSRSKSERVLAELCSAAKEGRIKTSPAQYAEQIWKEFT